ncbi:MAG: hypothetical protein JRJ62_01595 [Deltaproteobacteria bacterium]|nr:hypothetical protein [Deltaproteobacteria bacterium]
MEMDNTFDPTDLVQVKQKINSGEAPCNIHGLVKDLLQRVEELDLRVKKLEK